MLGYLPDSPWNRGRPAHNIPTLESSGGRFTRQYGILDYEELFKRFKKTEGKLELSKFDFDSYWWLDRSLDQDDHYRWIQEPDKVTSLRGRPAGGTAFAANPAAPRIPVSAPPPYTAPARLPGRVSGINPSLARNPSQFEIEGINLDDDDEAEPVAVVTLQAIRRPGLLSNARPSGGLSGAKAGSSGAKTMTKRPAGQSGIRKRRAPEDAAELAAQESRGAAMPTSRSGRKLRKTQKAAEVAGE
jgi:hypothetical protein